LNGREQCSPTGLRVNLDIEPASQHSYNLLGQATPLLFGPFTQIAGRCGPERPGLE
jgi:hypothetical protein